MEQATGKSSLIGRIMQLSRAKKIMLGVALVILCAYIALVIYRVPHALEQRKTAEAVAKIHAAKLTLDDVMGKNLPPDPGADADKTIEGIDANGNGIRDDVELAIFKLHPDSARIRAAELQYAMALQLELTEVFNSETLVATLQEAGRAKLCITDTGPKVDLSVNSPEEINRVFSITDAWQKEVDSLLLNNKERKDKRQEIFDYMVSYKSLGRPYCDIDLMSLNN